MNRQDLSFPCSSLARRHQDNYTGRWHESNCDFAGGDGKDRADLFVFETHSDAPKICGGGARALSDTHFAGGSEIPLSCSEHKKAPAATKQ